MKRILLLFFVTCCLYIPLKAQDFVTYNSDTEKTLLNSAQTPEDFIKLSLASELGEAESQVIYTKFTQDIKQLNLESVAKDRSERNLKQVQQLLKDHFLKNYNPHAHFGDFIVNGDYKDISASILYAYVLETLKVPYQIIQFPAHVYVVVNPGADNIKFETVDLSKGFFGFSDQSKLNNVNALIKGGYIEQSYAIGVGVERAFDDFFYSKTDITLKEAVGVLYFDKAFEEMQSEDELKEAYSDICKSDMLFPDKKNEFLKNDLITSMLNSFKYDDMEDWRALTHLVNNKYASDEVKKFLRGKFDDFMNDKLLNSGQKNKVDEVYNYLNTTVADTSVKKLIEEDYYFENSHYSYLTSDYAQSLYYLEKAYALNPNNPLITANFVQMILHKFSSQTATAQNLSLFDKYMSNYPLLKSNPVISSIYTYYMSCLSVMGFVTGDGATGEKYMQLLIHELDAHPGQENPNHRLIASAFAKASIYYFKKQGKQKAIAIIKEGLKYEPTDDELLRKLQADSQ